MAELYEVLLVDAGVRWHAGWLVDDETETDVLLRDGRRVPVFGSRAGLEHHAQEHGLDLDDDLPDEVDLDLGGWLTTGSPRPPVDEVTQLWHVLVDDPDAGRPLADEIVGEAYDDLVDLVDPDGDPGRWFEEHGETARRALTRSVTALRKVLDRPLSRP